MSPRPNSFFVHPIFTLSSLLSVASAGAPEDADEVCTVDSFDDMQSPPLPPNAEALMDSTNYVVLLSSDHNKSVGVWQQVDLDMHNVEGEGTEVICKHGPGQPVIKFDDQ